MESSRHPSSPLHILIPNACETMGALRSPPFGAQKLQIRTPMKCVSEESPPSWIKLGSSLLRRDQQSPHESPNGGPAGSTATQQLGISPDAAGSSALPKESISRTWTTLTKLGSQGRILLSAWMF